MVVLIALLVWLVTWGASIVVLSRSSERDRRARIAAEIELAQVLAQRDRLAEILVHYERPLALQDLRWVASARGLVLLSLN